MLTPSNTIGPRLTSKTNSATNPATNNINFFNCFASYLDPIYYLSEYLCYSNEPVPYFELRLDAYGDVNPVVLLKIILEGNLMKYRKPIIVCDPRHNDAIAIINGKSPSVGTDEDFKFDHEVGIYSIIVVPCSIIQAVYSIISIPSVSSIILFFDLFYFVRKK